MRIWKLVIYLLIIIILFLLILNIYTLLNKKTTIEKFKNMENPFNLYTADIFIEDNTTWMNKLAVYFNYMNQTNILARKFTKLEEMKDKYKCDGIQPLSETEKKYIINSIELAIRSLKTNNTNLYNYLYYWRMFFKLAKASSWLENGMPHTHEDLIILPSSFFNNNFQLPTFIHEITHIHQRKYPQDWDELIWKLGFQHYNLTDSKLDNILIRNRVNPDGLDYNYLWKNPTTGKYYWIGAIFSSITPTSLTDNIQYVACEMMQNNAGLFIFSGNIIDLNMFNDFNNYFGISNNHYHPNEIIAEYMTYYYNNSNISNIGYEIFTKYMDKYIWIKYENQ